MVERMLKLANFVLSYVILLIAGVHIWFLLVEAIIRFRFYFLEMLYLS